MDVRISSTTEPMQVMERPESAVNRCLIEIIPLEILDEIFSYSCMEDADLGFLLACPAMRWKLHSNDVVRVLKALLPCDAAEWIFRAAKDNNDSQYRSDKALGGKENWILDCDRARAGRLREQIMTASWCTVQFIRRIHVALMKRVLIGYWVPLLIRDGVEMGRKKLDLWAKLDRICENEDAWVKVEKIDVGGDVCNSRFPWVRVTLWPCQGRVVIRDQLYNKTTEYVVPLLESFMDLKGISREHGI